MPYNIIAYYDPFFFIDVEETRLAFKRHFERELPLYGNLCIVNLVEQSGKEKIIGDAFMEQIIHANDARITYVTFDFHEHWWEIILSMIF